jgi:hypothetical protein
MEAQEGAPPQMKCNDNFLVKSALVKEGTRIMDITEEMVAHLLVSLCFFLESWT